MARYAIVRDGKVIGIAEWDPVALPGWQPATGAAILAGEPVQADWNYDGAVFTAPTPAQTAARDDAVKSLQVDALDLVALRALFNHENRIRALESRPAVTAAQFRTAIKALL